MLHEQLVSRRNWVSEAEFQLAYALSRVTPGTNLLAFCVAAGWKMRRWSGALVALVAASVPCSALALVATHFYEVWQRHAMVRAALEGAVAAAVALMVNTAWVLAGPHLKAAPRRGIVIATMAIVLVTWLSVSPLQVLLLAAAVGFVWPAKAAAE